MSDTDTRQYAICPNSRSMSQKSESCENGRFQSLLTSPICV